MARGLISEDLVFYWNVHAHVGSACPNRADDVQLVQLGYWSMGNSTKAPISAADRALFAAIIPGAPYSGLANDPLTIAIKRHQQLRGGTQDGRVSPMQANQGYKWMIAALNNNIKDCMPSIWPNIDKHVKCPPALKASALVCFSTIAS